MSKFKEETYESSTVYCEFCTCGCVVCKNPIFRKYASDD